jgi:hypothetical protein
MGGGGNALAATRKKIRIPYFIEGFLVVDMNRGIAGF